ncbi:hypothetical protein [uncultured Psychroserpens sp.]|uniref:hypothetical protein n=1 Tax=uncultured Psychroserpens sp. TaxID=255436 RepID=UPI0026163FB1|nr:hypothetical protein [uncultured Psychroserpens sp.]
MKNTFRIKKIEILILIIGLVLNACDSNKKKNEKQTLANETENSKLFQLEIRLPFESSIDNYRLKSNFKLLSNQDKIIKSQFDTVTKTGGFIKYLLKKGTYKYSITTPFNETITKDIVFEKDTSYHFYDSCYEKVEAFSKEDLNNAQKINVSVTYEFSEPKNDEIQIVKKNGVYAVRFKKDYNWLDEVITNNPQIIGMINKFENNIIRLRKNKMIGTEEFSYLTASQVFLKYDNKLIEIHNLKNDSLYKITNELKQNLNKIL